MGRLTPVTVLLELLRRGVRKPSADARIDTGFVSGLAAIALGCGWVYRPLTLIVGGVCLTWVSWRQAKAAALPPAPTQVIERFVSGDRDEDEE